MEQKTEASQAVDELSPTIVDEDGLPMAIAGVLRSKGDIVSLATLYMLIDAWGEKQRNHARAAIKAQPAPTEAPKGPLDIPEPGNTNSLADRIFRLPCNWKGDHRLSAAVEMGHAMACEQAYDLAYEHAAKVPTEAA